MLHAQRNLELLPLAHLKRNIPVGDLDACVNHRERNLRRTAVAEGQRIDALLAAVERHALIGQTAWARQGVACTCVHRIGRDNREVLAAEVERILRQRVRVALRWNLRVLRVAQRERSLDWALAQPHLVVALLRTGSGSHNQVVAVGVAVVSARELAGDELGRALV